MKCKICLKPMIDLAEANFQDKDNDGDIVLYHLDCFIKLIGFDIFQETKNELGC